MDRPRIFLGSSGQQEKLLQSRTRGNWLRAEADYARILDGTGDLEPWSGSR